MTSSLDSLPPPLRCGLYRPGHDVHIVQALRSARDDEAWPGTASVDHGGWISITLDSGGVTRRWTHDPGRLAVLLGHFGGRVLLRAKSILSIPHDGGGAYYDSVGDDQTPCPPANEELSDLSWDQKLVRRGGVTIRLSD